MLAAEEPEGGGGDCKELEAASAEIGGGGGNGDTVETVLVAIGIYLSSNFF